MPCLIAGMLMLPPIAPLPSIESDRQPRLDRRSAQQLLTVGMCIKTGQPITMSSYDCRHGTLIAGRSGMGKTKLVEHLLRQLLIFRGTSIDTGPIIVADPHWSLCSDLLDFAAANQLAVPIVVIDPAGETVVAYDPLRSNPHMDRGQIAELVSQWIAHAWNRSSGDETPLLEENLKFVVNTILDAQGTAAQIRPLLDPFARLSDRLKLVEQLRDPYLKKRWLALLEAKPSSFLHEMGSTKRAFARFPAQANLMLGQPTSFSFQQAIAGGWTVLIRSNGENGVGTSLTSILIDDLWNAVMARGESDSPVTLVVDETCDLVNPQTAKLLSGTRKFGLQCFFLMQSPTQLRHIGEHGRRMFTEVLLNSGNQILFSLDARGASTLAGDLGVKSEVIRRLPREHALVHTLDMPTNFNVTVRSTNIIPLVPGRDEVREYVRARMSKVSGDFIYDRSTAIANLQPSGGTPAAAPDKTFNLDDEPDEFTKIIKSVGGVPAQDVVSSSRGASTCQPTTKKLRK